jgi:hypothetical protein
VRPVSDLQRLHMVDETTLDERTAQLFAVALDVLPQPSWPTISREAAAGQVREDEMLSQ